MSAVEASSPKKICLSPPKKETLQAGLTPRNWPLTLSLAPAALLKGERPTHYYEQYKLINNFNL